MTALCATAVATALAGLLSVGLALGPAAGLAMAIVAAPAFGAVSLITGVAAAIVALRRDAGGLAGPA